MTFTSTRSEAFGLREGSSMCLARTEKRCTLNSRVHCEVWVKVWFIVKDAMWGHFLGVYFFLIDPQNIIDGSTSSPDCSVINEHPGLFKFWADPVKPWITIKSPEAAISSRGKRNNPAVNFFCLAQSRNRERRPLRSFATPFSWQCRKLGSESVLQRTRPKANS